MTNTNTNNLEVIFQDLSEEDTASISGGGATASDEADAYFINTYGGGGRAITDTYTYAQDIGGTSISISRGVSRAIANKGN